MNGKKTRARCASVQCQPRARASASAICIHSSSFWGVLRRQFPTSVNWGSREAVRKRSSKKVRGCPSCFWQPPSVPSTQNLTVPLQSPGQGLRGTFYPGHSHGNPQPAGSPSTLLANRSSPSFHFLLKQTHPDRTGPVSAQPGQDWYHWHPPEQKKGFVVICMCSSSWQDDTQTSQAISKEIKSIHSQNAKSGLTQSLSWGNKRCFPEQKCLVKPIQHFTLPVPLQLCISPHNVHVLFLNNQMLFAKRHKCLAGLIKQKWHTFSRKPRGETPSEGQYSWKQEMLSTGYSQFLRPISPHLTLQRIRRFWTAGRVEFSFCPVTRCLSSTTWTASGLLAEHRRENTGIVLQDSSSVPGSHHW